VVARVLANKYLLALLVLLALAAIFGVASASRPGAISASSKASSQQKVTVSSVLRACAAPGSSGATASSVALAASASGTGQAKVTPLSPAGSTQQLPAVQTVSKPGQLALLSVPTAPVPAASPDTASSGSNGSGVPTQPAQGGVMVQATGAMARGFEAEQATGSGVASAQCLAPGTDFWFVGPGQKTASTIQLYLMNTDSQPADATVQLITDSGPILGSTDAGITVPPHGQVMQSLASVVNGSQALALNVTTSVGRVVAAVMENTGSGPGAWLPESDQPSTNQVLPGLPGTPGGEQLFVAVPGGDNAQIALTAITARGSYHPTGGTGINLPGGSAVSVPLSSLAGIPAAVRVTSNVPVTVSMMVPGGANGAPGAFTASGSPVLEQGVAAGNPGNGGGTTTVVLSAPGAKATVRVTVLTSNGQAGPAPQVVQIPAGHTEVATVSSPPGAAFAVVVTPTSSSGPVYAGRIVTQGGVAQSIIPMTSALTQVPLPAVNSSVTAALP
jgi:hypothetical protein